MRPTRKTLIDSRGLPFRLQVSRRRRTVGFTVTDTGELLVHAPVNLSLKTIYQLIDKNLAWIEKKQAERRQAWALLENGKAYYQGQALTLVMANSGPPEIRLTDGVLVLPVKKAGEDPWPRLFRWYLGQAEIILTQRVQHFAGLMGLNPPPLELRDWRRRWGECHTDGHLRFNWRLVLIPPEHLDYLVVHELAHIIVPGHPRRFWQEVTRYLPDYAQRRRWLKLYGAPFLVWKFEQKETPL
ncbi:MAG: SprT family zinc-dependent metalloprotease [Desulfobaccales bacterium]